MAEPTFRQDKPGGGKWYEVGDKKYLSVTTATEVVDKAALKIWAGQVAALAAVDNLPMLVAASLKDDCDKPTVAKERCNECLACKRVWIANQHMYESRRRANEGSEVHEAIDFWIRNGGSVSSLSDAAQPYFNQFLQFIKDYGLRPRLGSHMTGSEPDPGSWEQLEATLIDHTLQVAGTSDGAIWLEYGATELATEMCRRLGKRRPLIRLDYKTREKPDERLYNDVALQLVAYDRMPQILLNDGTTIEAPRTDGAAVLQLRPGGYTFRLVVVDDETYASYLATLAIYRWIDGAAKRATKLDSFPVGPEPAVQEVIAPADIDPWADVVEVAAAEMSWPEPTPTERRAIETIRVAFPDAEVVEVTERPRRPAPGPQIAGSFGPGDPPLPPPTKATTPPPAKKAAPARKKTTPPPQSPGVERKPLSDEALYGLNAGRLNPAGYDDNIPF